MAQSKLELAVGTGQWDAGLRKAQQALNAFTQAQGGLQQALQKDNGDMQKFVQMIGRVDSTANTAKGQMNDYKRVLEQLTADYNKMSEAQRASIGQDYLNTIDQLKQKFQSAKQQVDEFNRSLGNTSEIKLPDSSGLFGGGKLDGMLQVFGGNMLTKAAGFAASFASEIAGCVSQGVELARQGEGVRIAFERLGRGDILDGLREATHGTVTDIELMKAAVKFNDFKLPVEELGTMLAFAQQKAKDTGQSVDYMVDSIVTGLGRKSLMILDNLGLSAAEIKEKMAETGDMTKAVGEIIREQMAKAGDYVETAADRAAQANVNMQNKMEELGRKFQPLAEASSNLWTSMKIGILDVIGGPLTELLNKLTEAGRMMNAYANMGGSDKVGSMINRLKNARDPQSLYSQQQERFWRYINPREQQIKDIRAWQRGERGEALQKRVGAIIDKYGSLDATKIQAEVDAAKKMLSDYQQAAKQILTLLDSLAKADIDTKGAEQSLDSLKKKLKELEAERKKAVKAGDNDMVDMLTKQINTTKQNISYLDPNALKTTTGTDPVKKASEMVASAQHEYAQSIEAAKMSLDNGTKNESEYKKQILSAEEKLWNALGDAYQVHKDPKYKQAQDEAAQKIKELGGEVVVSIEAQKKAQEDARQLAAAEKKRAEELGKLKESAVSAVRNNDLKAAYQVQSKALQGGMSADQVQIPVTFTYTQANLAAFTEKLKSDLATADVGSLDVNKIMGPLADAKALSNIITYAMQTGIDMSDLSQVAQTLWDKIFKDHADILPEEFQKMLQEVSNKTGKSLQLDSSGNVKEQEKKETASEELVKGINTVTSGLSSVSSGLKSLGLELPKEVDNLINVLNGISSIISGVSQIISLFQISAINANTVAILSNTIAQGAGATASIAGTGALAGAVGGAATGSLLGPIGIIGGAAVGLLAGALLFSGGGVVRAANGWSGLVPGTSYSGDNIPAFLNAGETVLSHAQVGRLESELMGDRNVLTPQQPYVTGETIWLGLRNFLEANGYGDIMTTRQ